MPVGCKRPAASWMRFQQSIASRHGGCYLGTAQTFDKLLLLMTPKSVRKSNHQRESLTQQIMECECDLPNQRVVKADAERVSTAGLSKITRSQHEIRRELLCHCSKRKKCSKGSWFCAALCALTQVGQHHSRADLLLQVKASELQTRFAWCTPCHAS